MATPIRTRATTPKSNARATTPKSNATQTYARKATPTRSLAMTPSRDSQLIIEVVEEAQVRAKFLNSNLCLKIFLRTNLALKFML